VPPGDGWVRCALGHRHWGLFGAAGLLLRHLDPTGADWLLMQHRSWWSHHGDTWGLLGGARMPEESAEQAAGREAWEEAALPSGSYRLTGSYTDEHGGWSYTTVLADAGSLIPVDPARGLSAESADVRWVRRDELHRLALHPGFAASWEQVAPLLG
jgi:8-oxo-dGTP pyrophosphatase MutT (NUDIX family)